ncbi:MAG: TonB family protein, partial [Gammaproteobacteria bacterium]|nr:TonB family protein [Gammaproteobacteria bacterium]
MNALAQSALLTHAGWSLIHLLWQGALLGLVYACLRRVLRQARPQSRYLLALSALLALALLPVLTFLYLGSTHAPADNPIAARPALIFTVTASPASQASSALPAIAWLSWVVYAWLAGVAGMALRTFRGCRQVIRLRRVPGPQKHVWEPLLVSLCGRMRIQQAIQLFESVRVQAPVVIGWLKPVILIPPSTVCGLDWRQAEMILAHELAHIRRHDYLVNLLQVVVETLLFYHPVVHWISRDARNEREFCCDDVAMQTCGDRLGYLKALAQLEQQRLHASAALAASGGALLQRAYRLAYRMEPVGKLPTWSVILALLAALSAGVLLIHPRHISAKRVTLSTAIVAQPKALSRPLIPTVEQLQVVAIPAKRKRIRPAPTRLRPTTTSIELAQSLHVSPIPQALASLAPVPPLQFVQAPAPVAPGITVVAPHPLPQPEYPYQALRNGLGGTVQVSFRVSTSGQTTDISTKMISGPTILASTARAALENWQFKPVQL